jgi:hypothetical protein
MTHTTDTCGVPSAFWVQTWATASDPSTAWAIAGMVVMADLLRNAARIVRS